MALQPFTWGSGGQKITSPKQAEAQRRIAEALAKGTPAKNWAEGLANATGAWAGQAIEDRVAQAEAEGQQRAGGLFSSLAMNSSPDAIVQALTSPDAAWASDAQTSIASALLNQGMERADPRYQMEIEKAQLELEALRNGGGLGGSDMPSNVQEWQYYSQLSPEQQAQYLTMKRSNSPLNVGTGFVTQNPAMPGTTMGPTIPIYNEQEAYDTATGSAQGALDVANSANLPSAIATAEQGIQNIEALESDPNLWAAVGPLGMLPAVPGTSQAAVVSRIEQLQGGAFLNAYNSLKGGGAISEVEGKKAEQAIARLNRAQTETDFRQALKDLKEVIREGTNVARRKAGQSTVDSSATPTSLPEVIDWTEL